MTNSNGVLTSFALDDSLYADDVRAIKASAIRRHGETEWRKIVITNEIHGHLGIYSTIGAKMGLYALSLLCGLDVDSDAFTHHEEPTIVSFAGTMPPISCFNDGLQISTGSTIGHGLITISDEEEKRAEAVFTLDGKSLRLALRDEYQQKIRTDIKNGVELYGHSAPYWQYIRSLAIKYWCEWDRNQIFQVLE